MKQARQYIDNVLSGKEEVCELTHLAINRHLNDLNKREIPEYEFYFDEKEAGKAIGFFRILRHTSGKEGGKHFNLQGNQAFILALLFGWRRKDNGKRRFTQAYMEMARKAGKSELAAGIEIYTGFFENEEGAQVYTAATTRDQANMVFRAAKKLCRYLKADSKRVRSDIQILANSITYDPTDSFIQKVSADAGTLDGLNPHCAVIDEYHAHKTDEVKGVMQTGMGSRENPLLVIITTAGFEKQNPCFAVERTNAVQVLKGERRQENLFAIVFTQDEGEIEKIMSLDPEHPTESKEILRLARKSNPNLGSTPTETYLLQQVKDAQNKGASTRVQVLTKNFNVWLDAPKVWIPEEEIKAVMRPIALEEFYGRTVFCGIDLAATNDLTALAIYAPEENGLPSICKVLYWLPEATIAKRNDVAPYRDWVESGYIQTTPGTIVDYSALKSAVYDLQQNCQPLHSIGYDKWNAWQTIAEFVENGIEVAEVMPYYSYQSNPTKHIEKMISAGWTQLDENPVLLWNFRNIALDFDSQDNIKPNKKKSSEKIDGVAAMVDALYVYLQTIAQPSSGSYLFDESTELITI